MWPPNAAILQRRRQCKNYEFQDFRKPSNPCGGMLARNDILVVILKPSSQTIQSLNPEPSTLNPESPMQTRPSSLNPTRHKPRKTSTRDPQNTRAQVVWRGHLAREIGRSPVPGVAQVEPSPSDLLGLDWGLGFRVWDFGGFRTWD